jgi:hypothetical protein
MHELPRYPQRCKETNLWKKIPKEIFFMDGKRAHFIPSFKCIGSAITPLLNKDLEIELKIKKQTK